MVKIKPKSRRRWSGALIQGCSTRPAGWEQSEHLEVGGTRRHVAFWRQAFGISYTVMICQIEHENNNCLGQKMAIYLCRGKRA